MKPDNIVSGTSYKVDLESSYIGPIETYPESTTVDLPEGMPKEISNHLKNAGMVGRPMNISRFIEEAGKPAFKGGKPKPKHKSKPRKQQSQG